MSCIAPIIDGGQAHKEECRQPPFSVLYNYRPVQADKQILSKHRTGHEGGPFSN